MIFDMRQLARFGHHTRWIAQALETAAIIMYRSTSGKGLNTNIVDRFYVSGGRSFAEVHSLWTTLKSLTDAGGVVPVNAGSAHFANWFSNHILPNHPSEKPVQWYKLARAIAAEAAGSSYQYFPPLKKGAWAGYEPRQRFKDRDFLNRNHRFVQRTRPSSIRTVSVMHRHSV